VPGYPYAFLIQRFYLAAEPRTSYARGTDQITDGGGVSTGEIDCLNLKEREC
jgi:hypothetical protein